MDSCLVAGRGFTHDAQITGADVVQVGGFSGEVGVGQGQPSVGLFGVHASPHASFDLGLQLVLHIAVLHVIVLGQFYQLAVALHVDVGAGGFQGGLFGGGQELEVAGELGMTQALDFTAGLQAVPQHLVGTQGHAVAVEALRFRVAVGDAVTVAAHAGRQVHPGQVAASGNADLVGGGAQGIQACGDLRVAVDGLLGCGTQARIGRGLRLGGQRKGGQSNGGHAMLKSRFFQI